MLLQVKETAAEQLMKALVQSKTFLVEGKPLMTPEACDFIFEHARIDGLTEVTEVTPIFKATKDGWTTGDFHRLCDKRGPTLCLAQSSQNWMSAGFTSKAWESKGFFNIFTGGFDVEDASACVFALTDTLQVFKTKNPKAAVVHHRDFGPYW